MVALDFNWVYFTLVVFVSALVPGIALGVPFLKKSELSALEKLLLCFFIGLVVPPSMLLLESMVGLKFSLFLAIVNMFIVTAAGIIWGMKEKAFEIKMPKTKLEDVFSFEFARRHAATALLLIAVLFAFWMRLQSFSPIYSELDPYFYVYGSGQIIRFGEMPQYEDTAWWPQIKTLTHRTYTPLKAYVEAQAYSLYTSGVGYDNYLLFVISGWLPPIMAMLMAFGGYLLFSSYYGKRYGILAAFLLIFLPITLFKMSAGVNEAGPEGIASVFLVLGTYVFALRKNDLRIGILAGAAFFFAVLASNYDPVILLPVTGFIGLQAIDYFIRDKKQGNFLQITAVLVAGYVAASCIAMLYGYGVGGLPSLLMKTQLLICLAALVWAYALERNEFFTSMTGKQRRVFIAAVAILGLLVLVVPNPLGNSIRGMASQYVGQANFNIPLYKTIAEQNLAGASFEGEAGFLALVPGNHVVAQPADFFQGAISAACGILDIAATAFSAIGNAAINTTSQTANTFLGMSIPSVQKANSLLFFFLLIGSLGLAYSYFFRRGEDDDAPSIGILLLLVVLPISYVGLIKIKYTLFVGMALAVAAVVTVAEMERAFLWLAKKLGKPGLSLRIYSLFAALIVLLIVAQATFPSSYQMMIFSKSFEARYQDNPVAMMPKMAQMCEDLRKANYYDADICNAGYDKAFADTINGQFNGKVCLVSQLSSKELMPRSSDEQKSSDYARAGASFKCNRLSNYWVDSMDWISRNVDERDRVLSWWDYGHWINYFGGRKAVIRNEQASPGMIGRTAHDFLIGSGQDLIDSMNYFDSRYVLFDVEIIGGDTFGGKYGALNYLGCAHEGLTMLAQDPGTSRCEYDHSPERLIIAKTKTPGTVCTISESQQRTGVYAYRLTMQGIDAQSPAYCVGTVKISDGSEVPATYYLDKKDANGDLALSKGTIRVVADYDDSVQAEMVYDERKIWPGPNGTWVDGMEDAKTDFYRSNLYRGFYLENLQGFDLVYKSKDGEVKIFRMNDSLFKGNAEGWIDPVAAKQTQ